MAKLILSMDGMVLREIILSKERTTIGRKPHNDIQIDNLAVSGEHAVIVTILNDSFLEDLGSTNGTLVNGQPIKKHFLQNSDAIELGKYRLKYLNESTSTGKNTEFERTMLLSPGHGATPEAPNFHHASKASNTPNAQRNATGSNPETNDLGRNGYPLESGGASRQNMPSAPNMADIPMLSTDDALTPLPRGPIPPLYSTGPQPLSGLANLAQSAFNGSLAISQGMPVMDRNAIADPASPLGGTDFSPVRHPTGAHSLSALGLAPLSLDPRPPEPHSASATSATSGAASNASAPSNPVIAQIGVIQILTGSNAGRELELTKPLTTLGKVQVQVAVITKRTNGYYITHVEGVNHPIVNGKTLDGQATQLNDHDVIEIAGVKMEFYLKS